MPRKYLMPSVRVLGTVAAIILLTGCLAAQPTFRRNQPSRQSVDTLRLRAHVETLSRDMHPRNWAHRENMERCADYISAQFAGAGARVESQPVEAQGRNYRNVIGRFGAGKGPRIIVGAHYDSCDMTPGADDNASGVAALLELAQLFGRQTPDRDIELVAYVLEEPPFFRTPRMGSAVHAAGVAPEKENIEGVIVLEMVGYFSDERGSQSYPVPLLRCWYPGRGNYISVVGRWDQGDWIKDVKAGMKGTTDLPVYSVRAPAALPGIDFSDHLNYWPYGIKAVMITDTAFYRNRNYHTADDTPEKLDYVRMGKVVLGVFEAVRSL